MKKGLKKFYDSWSKGSLAVISVGMFLICLYLAFFYWVLLLILKNLYGGGFTGSLLVTGGGFTGSLLVTRDFCFVSKYLF